MWDPFQREMLEALGHPPMALAQAEIPTDPLLHALLRAAARDRDSADLAPLLGSLPAPASLRGNPGAKRALWPLLRQWRRQAR